MKKVLVVGLAMALLSGCIPQSPERPKAPQDSEQPFPRLVEGNEVVVVEMISGNWASVAVYRVRDRQLGTVCYVSSGISCMPDPQADIDEVAEDSDWRALSQEEATALLNRTQ